MKEVARAATLLAYCPAPDRRPPAIKALHTICGNNTSTVSSSWWWAYKCPKHFEQIISAINNSVVSSWFSSLRIYKDARTNTHQDHLITLPCFIRIKSHGIKVVQINLKTNTVKIKDKDQYKLKLLWQPQNGKMWWKGFIIISLYIWV